MNHQDFETAEETTWNWLTKPIHKKFTLPRWLGILVVLGVAASIIVNL